MATAAYPASARDEITEIIHGVAVADPYRWLEDGASAATRSWIAAQQRYAAPYFRTPERERLRAHLEKLIKVEAVGVPIERNGSWFFVRRPADSQQGMICRRHGVDGPAKVLIDPNPLDDDHLIATEILDVTHDGSLLAYGLRRGGEDEHEIRVIDVATRQHLPDELPRARYYQNLSWRRDNRGFYYSLLTESQTVVRFHRLGTDPARDREVFAASADKFLHVRVCDDGRYLLITMTYGAGGTRTDVFGQRLDPDGPIFPIVNDIEATSYAQVGDESFFILTNWNAPNWRVFRADLADPSRPNWSEIIPEGGAAIQYLATAGRHLIVCYLEHACSSLRVFKTDGSLVRDIELPEAGTAGFPSGSWDRERIFFAFDSFSMAPAILQYDIGSNLLRTWWQRDAADRGAYETRQVWFTSKDGTRVPMFLFHRRGLDLDGKRPTLLLGYGGFNFSCTPTHTPLATVFAEHDGVFALANLRGGGEFGEKWHQAGCRENKQNVFDDFIAAGEWLVANGYTNPDKLAAIGGSNGGLLVGAATTQRPDLFRAIICWAPLLDMIRFQHHRLGKFWVTEYGSSDNAEQFRYLLDYSPYHNVRDATRYPAVMLMTGDSDTRADPMHARKMAAALQRATSATERPILLHYRAESGHIAGLPADGTIAEAADQLTFLFHELAVAATL